MFNKNTTIFMSLEPINEFPVSLRVFLVVSACVASTLGNVIMLIIFTVSVRNRQGKGNKSNRCRVVDLIVASLAITALCRGLLLGPIQAACFIAGDWPLGNSVCQLQAYIEAMLRNLLLWYISLLSIERYTKHMVSHEYLATFSPLTVDIILPGILLIVIVQATAPLYGWGKYDYLRDTGLCSAATISTFGCSYALYLLFSLTLPPVSLITINAVMLSSKMFKKTKHTSKRNIPSGNSRIFTAEKEIIFLIIFTILFILMSIPRCIIDVAIMCSGIDDLLPTVVFLIYFLDSLTDVLLPIICLGLHPRARQLLCDAFRKNIIESPDMHLT